MDTYRGISKDGSEGQEPLDYAADYTAYEESIDEQGAASPPPPPIGQDERRMQVRAYNFWASLLDQGQFPPVQSLLDGQMPDFADHSVLLHFDNGIEDPAIPFLGQVLADECEAGGPLRRLSDIPGRSLLSRITDHYLQIIANQAPIGFEAEFVNQRGRTILYRGILLPFSTDNDTIDYLYGVINWKELADQHTTDALLLEVDQALDQRPSSATLAPRRTTDVPLGGWADGPDADSHPLDLAEIGAEIITGDDTLPGDAFVLDEPEPACLADWLASARDLAHIAHTNEDRTRGALYAAIGRAWDFALAAGEAPEDYAEMIADAGLTMQARAPLTPLVKLVFGADYDKTRIAEYTTALTHAQRLGLGYGELGAYLAAATGGLKGVVALERKLRRQETGKTAPKPRTSMVDGLRALDHKPLYALEPEGAEFALVLVRRLASGPAVLLGEIDDDQTMLERAARRLLG
ncbi:hypothetical protein NSE01_13520 [Novosphingobium sediminis]|uniref:Uncharacterized protein n=1 Tax=Novosphingobium sediminis TaxID=707214 RepID=A0A512AIH5_9SPHN|nr:hypothetical protein [Novosphingobium sediminis]GEN99519.1 hypothetical protein NSE01_13520 [Novosphingobium sediminis]